MEDNDSHIDWMSIPEVAALYGIKDRTVRTFIAEGKLTGYRISRKVIRLRRDEVDAALRPFGGARTTLDDYIEKIVAAAPDFTDEQRTRLATLLRTGAA